MSDPIDLLQVKIENARNKLPLETRQAIDAVDWRGAILSLREKKGYNFEQLGDLELETELVLCGLLNPANYPKEIESRMGISKMQADVLVEEMNTLVFGKIKEELIKNTERNKNIGVRKTDPKPPAFTPLASVKSNPSPLSTNTTPPNTEVIKEKSLADNILGSAGIEIMPNELGSGKKDVLPINKLTNPFKIPAVKTEYTLNNISKSSVAPDNPKKAEKQEEKPVQVSAVPKTDPYRMPIE